MRNRQHPVDIYLRIDLLQEEVYNYNSNASNSTRFQKN